MSTAATGSDGGRTRLDEALVAAGLAETRSKARALILAGEVRVNGARIDRAGAPVRSADTLELADKPRFASRGGEKLDAALATFGVDVQGMVVADFGASTGGFTDCLLQRGAAKVYAVDVGYGQLAERVRTDPRVVVLDRTNARHLESLPEPVDLVVIDVSFISLGLVLPAAARVLRPGGVCVPLVKPQFEAGRKDVGKGGVVRDAAVHARVLRQALEAARGSGFGALGLIASPLLGPAGNREFLGQLVLGAVGAPDDELVAAALGEERE